MKISIFLLFATFFSCTTTCPARTNPASILNEKTAVKPMLACNVDAYYIGADPAACHHILVVVTCTFSDAGGVYSSVVAYGVVTIGEGCPKEMPVDPNDVFYSADNQRITHQATASTPSALVLTLRQYLLDNPGMKTQVAEAVVSKTPR